MTDICVSQVDFDTDKEIENMFAIKAFFNTNVVKDFTTVLFTNFGFNT